MPTDYNFGGWATKNNLLCSDGRIIIQNAFADDDGQTVPLVWNHMRNEPGNVLGHAVLENKDDGVYAYCYLNDSENGKIAKTLVEHGDIASLSIHANQLKQRNSDRGLEVHHGKIREVSLVLAAANPGAFIDSVIRHGEESEEEGVIYTGEELELNHAEKEEEPKVEENEKKEPEKEAGKEKSAQNDIMEYEQKVIDSMNDEQKNVLYTLIGKAIEDTKKKAKSDEKKEEEKKEEGGDTSMKHNVFENGNDTAELTHSAEDLQAVITDAKRIGSMRDSALEHGITDIDYLFPEAKTMNNPPDWIKRDTGWVSGVMSTVHHTPFSRIKSQFANITEDEARAKGYIKGSFKKEEVFTLLKRTTTPCTIYKKQKLDRDDIVDITDFDVVSWIKGEMRMMLDEEIARAILVGDGRSTSDDDKISETNIRPVWKDDDLYTIKADVGTFAANDTDDTKAKAFIKAAIKSRKHYKGSGNPVLYTTEDMLTNMLLLTDGVGRDLYESVEKLCQKLRVSKIVTVEVMEDLTRTDAQGNVRTLMGIIVNLVDYNVGADKGGAVNMFDDFDIDYNAQKYLIETRCSGALIKPYSAIALECIQNDKSE